MLPLRGGEGELNFLTYPDINYLGLCIRKDNTRYGLGAMRPVLFQRNSPDAESGNVTLLLEGDSFNTILNELNYKMYPIFMEVTSETTYNLYYYTSFNISQGMKFYCSDNDIEIFTDDGSEDVKFMWRRVHSTITWTDF